MDAVVACLATLDTVALDASNPVAVAVEHELHSKDEAVSPTD